MPNYRAIDVVVFPFTPDTKRETYQHVPVLKQSLVHLGIWDKEWTASQIVAEMDAAGVEKALVCAQESCEWRVPPEYIHELVDQTQGRLLWTAGIDPHDIAAGVRQLEASVERGALGGHSYPHWFRLSPDDRVYYPFYSKCVELDVPIQIQVGIAYQAGLRNVGRPDAIDRIAVDFPGLRIIGIHIGYPWEREMISVAWKHPNVYIGADCLHPRDWSQDLVDYVKGAGREKVLWGTNKPVFEFDDSLAGVDDLGLDDETKRNLLYENVKRVYRL
ncbi:MAG: amidohydrolase family protein [Actinomycetia bacterium]|nr:amidohydrolase family protein [Actinomycetes bacterium]